MALSYCIQYGDKPQTHKKNATSIDALRDSVGDEPASHEEAPDAHMLQEENARRVWSVLGRMSDDHRKILLLREMDGFDYEQIGDELDGVNVGTVRSRLHRARQNFKAQYSALDHDGEEEAPLMDMPPQFAKMRFLY